MDLKTPFYTLNKDELDHNIDGMHQALSTIFDKYIIGYSFKTNSLPWIINYMKSKNCYAEVVSYQEYQLAKYFGYQQIVYNGPMKDKVTFFEALSDGQIVNIETYRELDWLDEFNHPSKIGLRVNFDIECFCPGESACGSEGGRFGFCYENKELERVIQRLSNMDRVQISGLHLHVSSKTRSVAIYEALAQMAYAIVTEYQLDDIEYIDMGGGFFGGLPDKPDFSTYFSAMKQHLKELSEKTIIVEPGASIIASAFTYTASVIDIKDTTYNRFVVLDGSRNDLDPQFKRNKYLYRLLPSLTNTHPKQVLAGYTCMEADRITTLTDEVELKVGDQICFEKVGSYTMALAPNFIKYAPRVYLSEAGNIKSEIRKEWGVEEYVAGSYYE